MIHAHILLIDADHRVLMLRDSGMWTFPSCAADNETSTAALVAHLRDAYKVTTFDKALFPLSFVEQDGQVHLFYGCRNWVGPNNLQIIPQFLNNDDATWIRVARINDNNVTPIIQSAYPILATLLMEARDAAA